MADPTANVDLDQNLVLAQLRRRVEMEKLVLGITQDFLESWSHDLDGAINLALSRIGELLTVDRSYLFLFDLDEQLAFNTHEWCAKDIQPEIQNLQGLPLAAFRWSVDHLSRESHLDIPEVDALGEEAAHERENFQAQGIMSLVLVRLTNSDGVLKGFLGLDTVRSLRPWQDEDVYVVEVIGNIIATALEQDQVRKELIASEALNRMLLETLPDCMLVFDAEGLIRAFSAPPDVKMAAPRDQVVGMSIWSVLAENDHERAKAAIEEALHGSGTASIEYSLVIEGELHHFEGRFIRKDEAQVLAVVRKIHTT